MEDDIKRDLVNKKKAMIAMSGGVDSSVAAYLLKKAGYDVVGVTMCFGVQPPENDNSKPRCCGADAIIDAKKVCRILGLKHYVFDFSGYLKERIIEKFIQSYLNGRTPNPCIDCNQQLKFDILLNKALGLGFDFLATGHYAKIIQKSGVFYLKTAKDKAKDQTYFLYRIKKEALRNLIFPLSDLNKKQVRKIAQDIGLTVSEKKESQEICFISGKNYRDFILKNIDKTKIQPGNILDINGKIIGKHNGIAFFTIGQRKGFGISSTQPLYVIKIKKETNEIVVGPRNYLKNTKLIANDIKLLVKLEEFPKKVLAKIRYNHKPALCNIININNFKAFVVFDEAQEAITPGQSIVFYKIDDEIVLGGGVISEVNAK